MFGFRVKSGRGSYWMNKEKGQALLDYLVAPAATPPVMVKHASIAHYQKLTGYRLFIETGTFLGETLGLAAEIFDKCYSVELSEKLHRRARLKFARKRHVELLNGSSAELLPAILRQIEEPAVIWLDAHFSGGITTGEGCDPLQQELTALLEHRDRRHVILIDDARGLGVSSAQLSQFIAGMGPGYQASLLHDSVRLVPTEKPLLGQPLS